MRLKIKVKCLFDNTRVMKTNNYLIVLMTSQVHPDMVTRGHNPDFINYYKILNFL